MAWTETARHQYARREARYASDCTDAEWAIVEPFMPPPSLVGRPRKTPLREVWNAIQYIAGLPMGDAAKGLSSLPDGAALLLSAA